MFVYYSEEQARNRDYRGPDFFFVWGVSPEPVRPYWAVWKEGGHYPDVIIELLSPTTAENDRTVKKDLYEQLFHTSDYYCYDPETRQLEGWHLNDRVYHPISPNGHGRLWCKELGLWLGTWDGPFQGHTTTWLRLYTPEGALVPTAEEAGRKVAEIERRRADAEFQRAEAERQRADALEAEVARLRARLGDPGEGK
jgi:hypothetical protein